MAVLVVDVDKNLIPIVGGGHVAKVTRSGGLNSPRISVEGGVLVVGVIFGAVVVEAADHLLVIGKSKET